MILSSLRRRAPAAFNLPVKLAIAGVVAVAMLSGCATTSGPRSTVAVAPYRESIEVAGTIFIDYIRDGKHEPLNANFIWRQSAAATEVSLTAPTGQVVAVINVTPTSATLRQSGQAPRTAPDLDSLTQQTLGWTLPVSGLRDWLQGYATDAGGKRFIASPANNTVVTRDGWKLEYVSWQEPQQDPAAGAAPSRPKRIDLTRLGAGQVDELTIRIAIRSIAE